MIVRVRASLNPTESSEKVLKSILNLFDFKEAECERTSSGEKEYIICVARSISPLYKLRNLLRQQRILDAARSYIERGMEDTRTVFYLNKQAAFMGKVSFCTYETGESPLGAIVVSIEFENCGPEQVLDWLAPRTVDGKPVNEVAELNC
jgi:predicted RNA binding protein with dsRBD fold (UPF0201 family)